MKRKRYTDEEVKDIAYTFGMKVKYHKDMKSLDELHINFKAILSKRYQDIYDVLKEIGDKYDRTPLGIFGMLNRKGYLNYDKYYKGYYFHFSRKYKKLLIRQCR